MTTPRVPDGWRVLLKGPCRVGDRPLADGGRAWSYPFEEGEASVGEPIGLVWLAVARKVARPVPRPVPRPVRRKGKRS